MKDDLSEKSVVFLGDISAGKTSMFLHYFRGQTTVEPGDIPIKVGTDNGPIVYTYNKKSDQKVRIYFDDHDSGAEDMDGVRHFWFNKAHVVVLCFSIGDTDHFERIEEYWYPFVKKYASKCPIILCACQLDLRTNQEEIDALARQNRRLVTTFEGKKMAEKIKAVGYYECSSYNGEGVKEVFEAAAEATNLVRDVAKKCLIM